MRLRLLVAAALLAFAIALPATAYAGQIVYRHGEAIWVMDDDGSHARALIAPAAAQSNVLRDPSVVRDGGTIVFAAETERFKHTFTDPETELFTDHFGRFATGVWRWQGGRATRLSPPPAPCDDCTGRDQDPAAGEDGRVLFEHELCRGAVPTTCERTLRAFGAESESATDLGQACGKEDYDAPRAVAPNPGKPSEIAYIGCADEDGFERIWVSGERRSGERPIAQLVTDDTRSALAWRPDGGLLVARAGGPPTDAGLIALAPDGAGARRILEEPPGIVFNSPSFIGNDRIVFGATSDDGPANLYTVRADCRDCRFPGDVRQLTRDNVSAEPSWTPAGGVGRRGAGESNPLVRVRVLRGRRAPRRGVGLRITLRRAATVSIRVRRGKLRLGSVNRRLRKGTSTVKLRRVGRRALRKRRRYNVRVAVAGFPAKTVRPRAR
jgi:hypothetical protein